MSLVTDFRNFMHNFRLGNMYINSFTVLSNLEQFLFLVIDI